MIYTLLLLSISFFLQQLHAAGLPTSIPVPPKIEELSIAPQEVATLNEQLSKQVEAPSEETADTLDQAALKALEQAAHQKPVLQEVITEQPPVVLVPPAVVESKKASSARETAAVLQEESKESTPIYLGSFLKPWEYGNPEELLEFDFENAEFSNFVQYIEKHFGLTFIYDDQINPAPPQGKKLIGTKITFKTHQPLTKKEAWDLFVAFLDVAGLAPQPGPSERVYRLTSNDPRSPFSVTKGPMPTFIGIEPSLIPNNDTRIRYVYFIENTSMDVIKNVVDTMKSASAPNVIIFPEFRALIMTDKAANVKAMLNIIRELDRVNMPEVLSVIKLKRTDATKVAELYKALVKDESQQGGLAARLLGGRKQGTTTYFPEGTRVIPEPRTNTLILLGNREAVKKIEEFIIKEIDRELDIPFSPLHIYQLKYVEAEAIAAILKEAVQFQVETEAAKSGGVRDGDKYLRPMSITPEKTGNRLIINANYDDYVKVYETLQKLDVEQPQVAIKVYILNVDFTDTKQLGVQMRNKVPGPVTGLLGPNVNFQDSGLAGTGSSVVENPNGSGATRLLGDLVNLAASTTTPGATWVTLGSDAFGVWGMLKVLETYTNISVISNPFLIATHKYPAVVALGTIRRILTGTSLTTTGPVNSFDDLSAKLEVYVEPQISYEGFITLNVRVLLEQFDTSDQSSGNRISREVKTSVIMANNQVLALGGLIVDRVEEDVSKWPILGDIPIFGWLFKNKNKIVTKSSLLILITPEIIQPNTYAISQRFTQGKINEAKDVAESTYFPSERRDPIHRWFFKDNVNIENAVIDEFMDKEDRYIDPNLRTPEQDKKIIEKRPLMMKKRMTDYLPSESAQEGVVS